VFCSRLSADGHTRERFFSDADDDLFGGVGYTFNESYSFIAGCRHIKIDYENDTFLYDVKLYGPIAGMTFKW
jgi:hypothetical protein